VRERVCTTVTAQGSPHWATRKTVLRGAFAKSIMPHGKGAAVHLGAATACLATPCGPHHQEIAIARRYPQPEQPTPDLSDASPHPWGTRIQILIAVALGAAAIVTAAAVYRNEQEDHKATKDFHAATSYLVSAVGAGITSPRGRELEALAEQAEHDAEDHQDRATSYTLAELILATSLFLFGIAGVSSLWIIKIGAFSTALVVFAVAVVVLATF
jgi:hypothetical protein